MGWNVTVQATQLTATNHTLRLGSVSMPAPTVAKAANAPLSGALPTIETGPQNIDGSSAVKIATAPVAATDGTGMGSYVFTPGSLTLSVGADAYAATYTSTVTVSVISGP